MRRNARTFKAIKSTKDGDNDYMKSDKDIVRTPDTLCPQPRNTENCDILVHKVIQEGSLRGFSCPVLFVRTRLMTEYILGIFGQIFIRGTASIHL